MLIEGQPEWVSLNSYKDLKCVNHRDVIVSAAPPSPQAGQNLFSEPWTYYHSFDTFKI